MRTLSILFLASILTIAAILSSFATTPVAAWWCTGHMLIAKIAEQNLDPITREVVNNHFKLLSVIGPFEKVTDMVTGACWADDIKSYGLEAMSPWHFVNYPYEVNNYSWKYANCPMQQDNSAKLLPDLVKAAGEGFKKPWVGAFALAYVVHLYGDIHQPLHCVDMFSQNYTDGDRGGNFIHITFPPAPPVKNLHGFWDSVCGRWDVEWDRPLNSTHKEWLAANAARINTTYNISHESANWYNPEDISKQSYDLAKSEAYPGVMTDNEVISMDYQARCIPVAEKQIFRAGMRLANTLKHMFKYNREHNKVEDFVANLKKELGVNNSTSPSSSGSEWNGRATGALFGGIVIGVVLVVAFMMIQKRTEKKGEEYTPINVENNTA